VFQDLKNVKKDEKSLKIGQVLPILANFSQFKSLLKKVGRGRDDDIFKI
jgi:hypothetical protein